MNKLKSSTLRLGGVKYWAQWFPIGRKPQYELFVFVGDEPAAGQYYFAHYKNPQLLICKNFYQLTNDFTFRPFMLELAEQEKYAREKGLL